MPKKKAKKRKGGKKRSGKPKAEAAAVVSTIDPERDLSNPESQASKMKAMLAAHALTSNERKAETEAVEELMAASGVSAPGQMTVDFATMLIDEIDRRVVERGGGLDAHPDLMRSRAELVGRRAALTGTTPAPEQDLARARNVLVVPNPAASGRVFGAVSPALTEIGRATERANAELCAKSESRTLTADHVAFHAAFLTQQREKLVAGADACQKRSKVLAALMGRCRDRSRIARYTAEHGHIKRQFEAIKSDTVRFNLILQQFQKSPAYSKMLDSVNDVAVWTPSGALVIDPSKDGSADAMPTFEELMAEERGRVSESPGGAVGARGGGGRGGGGGGGAGTDGGDGGGGFQGFAGPTFAELLAQEKALEVSSSGDAVAFTHDAAARAQAKAELATIFAELSERADLAELGPLTTADHPSEDEDEDDFDDDDVGDDILLD